MSHTTSRCLTLPALTLALAWAACASPMALAQDRGGAETRSTAPGASEVVAVPKLRENAAAMLLEFAERGTPEQRANALEALLPMPARLEQPLRSALRASSPGVRGIAAMVVGRGRLNRLVDAVRPLVNDESPQVRASAIYAMAKNNTRVDQTPLADMLAGESVALRAHAAFILGDLGNASAAPMLLEASGAPAIKADPVRDRLMRLQIAEALCKIGRNEAIHEIRAALYPARPEDLEACALAVQILGQIKDEASKGQVRNLLRENYEAGQPMPIEIRLAAAMSLARMGEVEHTALATRFVASDVAAQRAQAALVLGESGDRQYLATLQTMMEDREPLVRIAAAAGILKITEGAGRGRQ